MSFPDPSTGGHPKTTLLYVTRRSNTLLVHDRGQRAAPSRTAGEEERTGARDWGCWLWRREGANQSEKEGERWVTGTEIGVGVLGIWIVRGNEGEKSGSSATLGVVSSCEGCDLCPCVVGRGFLNVWGKKLASFYKTTVSFTKAVSTVWK